MVDVAALLIQRMACLVHCAHEAGEELGLLEACGDAHVRGVRPTGERVNAQVEPALLKRKTQALCHLPVHSLLLLDVEVARGQHHARFDLRPLEHALDERYKPSLQLVKDVLREGQERVAPDIMTRKQSALEAYPRKRSAAPNHHN